ncbi:MAG: DUF882 domain-containing protein [Reyranella sp.]|uniref:DUF882 domain-containing protein n=1 Tax=Reyranella sp. TaxID=1929291 RepID=UPI002730025B|nr:DUF882 domain-containing protein [Reyranella sp.]MDP1963871.1 DUF882 domain-containing protein [Reyranella sp.]MDP2373657.1 DUF882 domain-containing protein [Reyranella sp.]
MSVAALLAIAGTAAAQTNPAGSVKPEVLRGTTADVTKKTPPGAKAPAPAKSTAVRKTAAAPGTKPVVQRGSAQRATPETLRATRYGGFAPAQPPGPPPSLDTTSPRSLSLVSFNTQETLTVTYWSNGAYHRDALDKLNHFLRDSRDNALTEMDPLLFDVLWHTMQILGYGGSIEVLSAFRSPTTNAWLASVSRGVARDSQHMNGNAMDIRFPGVPVYKIRQAARALNMGGVGFYPRSGFVHLDTGPVRYW